MNMVDGQEGADGQPAHQQERRLCLVPEPKLVRFIASVHACQGTEHRVHHELGPADGNEEESRHNHAEPDAYGR